MDLLTVDGFGDGRPAVADEPGDVPGWESSETKLWRVSSRLARSPVVGGHPRVLDDLSEGTSDVVDVERRADEQGEDEPVILPLLARRPSPRLLPPAELSMGYSGVQIVAGLPSQSR
ncbi:hypothetical protein [Nonomuraea sp. NPDC003709]|uniref:hypothetical protein n=1 Tax=Nonomuraea sp. NPDC003709 TaxID=3154450 RepID=UPI0033A79ECE